MTIFDIPPGVSNVEVQRIVHSEFRKFTILSWLDFGIWLSAVLVLVVAGIYAETLGNVLTAIAGVWILNFLRYLSVNKEYNVFKHLCELCIHDRISRLENTENGK